MEKKFIEDKQGNKVLPITHVSAVLDDNGNDIGSVMGAFEDEVRGLVDTPHQEYVTVATYASLPASGSKDTIYRVSNYNGSTSQVDASVYSEYAWNGSQYVFLCVKSQIREVFDISVYNNNAKYADLAAALNGGANIPQSLQKGGMSVKFVQSSVDKYVDKSVKAATNLQNYTVGYRVEQDGSIVQDVNAIVSGKIEIGAQRIMWWHGQGSNLYLVAFDANNVVLNFWSGYSSYYRAITLPANTSYIIASFTKDASYPKMITRGSMYDVVWEASENCNVVEAAENQNSINEEDTFNPIVPSYYKAHLQSKIDAINQRDASCGNSQDSFVFITDTHIEVNYLHSPALVEKIIKGTSVKKVFHGGDVFDGQATKELGIGLYKKFMSLFPFCNPLITIGNHDLNIADRMTANELYGTCIKPIEHLVITNKKNYYYLDNENQKIRYFFMDMHTPSENYPREGEVNFTEQLNWLNDKALEVGSNWSIIVITHILFVTPTIEGGVIVGATKSDLGERLIAKLDTMYDNASMPTIIGVICGHTHWDWSEYSTKGYPIIATTTDSSYGIDAQGGDVAWDTSSRTPMTISEQAFDVVHIDTANKKIYMERVGYGSNREFSY